jgi:hypothetical protein
VAVIFVTGMSGAGKSTALAELARRGHSVVDTDESDWTEDGRNSERLWRADKMNALLAEHAAGTLFVSGCVDNQAPPSIRCSTPLCYSARHSTCCWRGSPTAAAIPMERHPASEIKSMPTPLPLSPCSGQALPLRSTLGFGLRRWPMSWSASQEQRTQYGDRPPQLSSCGC